MEWENIVNQNSAIKKHNEHREHKKKLQQRSLIAGAISLAFLLTTACELVDPVLGIPGMVITICAAWFYVGRAWECAR